MKKEFLINWQGNDFAKYEGLLDQAHQEGLSCISTSLIQVPSEANGMVAIVHATVTTSKGTFDGIGDASPANVGRMIIPHIIRMAETRAKARAMRDAVNIGVTAFEELGEPEGQYGDTRNTEPVSLQPAERTGNSGGASGRGPSPKQTKYAGELLAQHGFPPLPEGIDGGTVSTWIDALKTDGSRAQLINPTTGQVLRSTGQGDGSMADMDGDLRAADAHFREMAARDVSPASSVKPASANQFATIAKLAKLTGEAEGFSDDMTSAAASERITELSRIWNEQQAARRKTPAGRP